MTVILQIVAMDVAPVMQAVVTARQATTVAPPVTVKEAVEGEPQATEQRAVQRPDMMDVDPAPQVLITPINTPSMNTILVPQVSISMPLVAMIPHQAIIILPSRMTLLVMVIAPQVTMGTVPTAVGTSQATGLESAAVGVMEGAGGKRMIMIDSNQTLAGAMSILLS